jgi:hypothetical protein
VAGKEGEAAEGRMDTQYVPEVFPKTVAARKILFVAGAGRVSPMGSVLLLPPEA